MVVVVLGLGLGAAACGSDGGADGADRPGPLPPGVTVFLDQARQDQGSRRVQIQVRNAGPGLLTVDAAELRSSRVRTVARYRGPALVAAGAATNLTVPLGTGRCARDGEGLGARVVLTAHREGGPVQRSQAPVRDRYDGVGRLLAGDCARSHLRTAELGRVTVSGRGTDARLDVELVLAARAGGPPVRVDRVLGTTLLAPVGGSERIGRTLAPGGPPLRARVRFVPNRCDVHVVAEDRAGTILLVRLAPAGGPAGTLQLRMDEPRKAVVFDWLAERCRFADADDR